MKNQNVESSNQLMSCAFSDGKLIPTQEEIAKSQVSNNNDNMLFHLPPASFQVQWKNDEKQTSNNYTMDQI